MIPNDSNVRKYFRCKYCKTTVYWDGTQYIRAFKHQREYLCLCKYEFLFEVPLDEVLQSENLISYRFFPLTFKKKET